MRAEQKGVNTYSKYCPNVYLAKSTDEYKKGDTIIVTTKRGKENKCEVHNLVKEQDGYFYYSITRIDDFNYAQSRAERYRSWVNSADKKARQYMDKADEHKDFLALGEPIKVGHHSEGRHRRIIDQRWNNIGKAVEQMDKRDEHIFKADYWENRADDVDLSMPESLEYFTKALEDAREYHEGLKSAKYPREHAHSLNYVRKKVRDLEKKVEIATKLWA